MLSNAKTSPGSKKFQLLLKKQKLFLSGSLKKKIFS